MTLTSSSPVAISGAVPLTDTPVASLSPPRSDEMRRYHGHGQILWEELQAMRPDLQRRHNNPGPSRLQGRLVTSAPLPEGVDRSVDAHLVRPGTIAMTLPANRPATPAALAALAGVLLDHRVGLIVDLSDPALSKDHALHTGGHFGIPPAAADIDFARTGESPPAGVPEDVRASTLKIGLALGPDRKSYGNGPIQLSCLKVDRVERENDRHCLTSTGPGIALSPADTVALVKHLQAFRAEHPDQAIVIVDDPIRPLGGQLIAAEAIAERHRQLPGGLPRPIGELKQQLCKICEPLQQQRGTLMPASHMQATALIGFIDQWRAHAPTRRARLRRADLPPPPPPPPPSVAVGEDAATESAQSATDRTARPAGYRIGGKLATLAAHQRSLSNEEVATIGDAHAKGLSASVEAIEQLVNRPKRSLLKRVFGRSRAATTSAALPTERSKTTHHSWWSRLRFWR